MTHELPRFVLACLVLAMIPGPASVLCVHRTLRDGRRAGMAAVLGNEIGLFGWALAGGAGLSVLLTANRVLYDTLHVAGGLVLVWLGVQAWRSARRDGGAPDAGSPRGRTPAAAFRASLVSIAANPKAAAFAIFFFPQFLPEHGPLLPTLVALAAIQVLVDSAWTAGIVMLAGRAGAIWSSVTARARLQRALGAILAGLGTELAVDR
jgi:threonine/homoserine/homoserine lactone efflux protein